MYSETIINIAENINDYRHIAALAEKIWTEHYEPIIGADQVKYMIEKYQSASAIEHQCTKEGYIYYQAFHNGTFAGYCAIRPDNIESIFLSKIYVDKIYRGHGIAKDMINHFIKEYRPEGLNYIWLTVNKYNSGSIKAYEKMGFKIIEDLVTDIGGGFIMDDYKMAKSF